MRSGIDGRRVAWRRAIDMNDRSLRQIVSSLGGVANGFPARGRLRHHRRLRGDGDLLPRQGPRGPQDRLGNIIVAYTRDRKPCAPQTSRRTAR
jgi:formate--tetrahydrofolate ligase